MEPGQDGSACVQPTSGPIPSLDSQIGLVVAHARIVSDHWLFYVVIQDDAKSHSVWGKPKGKIQKKQRFCRRGGATLVLGLSDNNPYAAPAPGPHPPSHLYYRRVLGTIPATGSAIEMIGKTSLVSSLRRVWHRICLVLPWRVLDTDWTTHLHHRMFAGLPRFRYREGLYHNTRGGKSFTLHRTWSPTRKKQG